MSEEKEALFGAKIATTEVHEVCAEGRYWAHLRNFLAYVILHRQASRIIVVTALFSDSEYKGGLPGLRHLTDETTDGRGVLTEVGVSNLSVSFN